MAADSRTIKKIWPDVYKKLLQIKEISENHFKDVCNIVFTVQEKEVYVMQVRKAKRTPKANLRFALELFQEGKIGIGDVLARIKLEDIEDIASPFIKNKTKLTLLGKGLPASRGICTGKIVLRGADFEKMVKENESFVFVTTEVSPEDTEKMLTSRGVLTTCGGRTSHAAVICRGWRKPCIVGFCQMEINYINRTVFMAGITLKEGDWITIDGATGLVYAGKGEFAIRGWEKYPELVALYKIIAISILLKEMPLNAIGWAWCLMDYFMYSTPIRRTRTQKKQVDKKNYISFIEPIKQNIDNARSKLIPISENDCGNYSQILFSFNEYMAKLLSFTIGIGLHYKYFRPLWNPLMQVKRQAEGVAFQFVGFEYFHINKYIHHLIDVSQIVFHLEVKLDSKEDEWFLDFTNPNGESLVANSDIVTGYRLLVNNAEVQYGDLPLFCDAVRRRGLCWQWYENKNVSYETIKEYLYNWQKKKAVDKHLHSCCQELGLIRDRHITSTGQSLLE